MNKVLTAALAAVIASSTLGLASAAEAQSRDHDRYEQRNDSREHRRHDREHRREDRDHRRADRYDNRHDDRYDRRYSQYQQQRQYARQQQRAYARWQQSQVRYNRGHYQAPRGYTVRQWSYGQQMPYAYRSSNYIVNDYNRYGLRAPPRGYQYVRSGNDVVLSSASGGLIAAVIAGLFN